ncbi:MAG: hypothetical protein LM563_05885 [Thermofilum sp.]|jgi:predicted transcriptional regulator|nr:hypothetical protein [Thermofilum sp.]MCC6059757.1 hypothetical protein [Thermofilum sp.]
MSLQSEVERVLEELIKQEKFNAIAVLLYLRRVQGALTQDLRRVIGRGNLANASYTRSILQFLEERGLVKYVIVSRHKVWQLTELGSRVAEEIERRISLEEAASKLLGKMVS